MLRWLCGIVVVCLISKIGFSQSEVYRNGCCFGLYNQDVLLSDGCFKFIEQFSEDAYIAQTWSDRFGLMSSDGSLMLDTTCIRIERSSVISRLFIAKDRVDGFKLCTESGEALSNVGFTEYRIEYGYVLFKVDDKWGMMSHKGEVLVKPEHKEVVSGFCPISPCSSQRFLLNTRIDQDYRFEMRDMDGNVRSTFYKEIPQINSIANRYVFKQNGRYVVIDKFGNVQMRFPLNSQLKVDYDGFTYHLANSVLTVYGPIGNLVGTLNDVDRLLNTGRNFAIVKSGDKTKIINSEGKAVFDTYGSFNMINEDCIVVNEGKLSFALNNNWERMTEPSSCNLIAVYSGLGVFSAELHGDQQLYSLKTGQKLSKHGYSGIREIYGDQLAVSYGLRGPYDLYKNGRIKRKQELSYRFNNNRQLQHSYTGTSYLPYQFHHLIRFNDSVVLGSYNAGYDKLFNYDYYLINLNHVHLMQHFEEIKMHDNHDWLGSNIAKDTLPPSNEFVVVSNDKWGVIAADGSMRLPVKYDSIIGLSNVHLAFTKYTMEVHFKDGEFNSYKNKNYEILTNYIYVKEDNLHKLYCESGADYTIEEPRDYKNLESKDLYYQDKSGNHIISYSLEKDVAIKYHITRAIVRDSEPCLYEFKHKNKLGVLNNELEVIVKPKMSEIHLDNDHMLYMIKKGKVVTKVID